MPAHGKAPYITPSMEFSSREGVVAGSQGAASDVCPVDSCLPVQHENKTSVLNFKLSMVREFSEPIKSKSRLVFYSGLRQFSCEPIFSSNSIGEKHKFER